MKHSLHRFIAESSKIIFVSSRSQKFRTGFKQLYCDLKYSDSFNKNQPWPGPFLINVVSTFNLQFLAALGKVL